MVGNTLDVEHDATVIISHDVKAIWTQIRCPASISALTVFNLWLVLVIGGRCTSGETIGELWSLEDEGKGKWGQPLPAMPTARSAATAVTMNNYLIVAGGFGSGGQCLDVVEVYYTTCINSLPSPSSFMQTIHYDAIFYLASGLWQGNSIFYSSLQTVIHGLSSPTTMSGTPSQTSHTQSPV